MILTLEVTPPQAATLGPASRATFGPEGGSIGRERNSDWVLPHTKVSGRHARISCANGVFYIEDTSTNGVFVNASKTRLVRGRPHALKSGDRLFIDPYEIVVAITGDADVSARRPFVDLFDIHSSEGSPDVLDPFGSDDPFVPQPLRSRTPARPPRAPSTLEPHDDSRAGQELDPLKLLGSTPQRAPVRDAPSAKDLDRGSPLGDHYQPPAVPPTPAPPSRAPAIVIPADYDPLGPDDSGLTPLPEEAAPVPSTASADVPVVTPSPATPLPVVRPPVPPTPVSPGGVRDDEPAWAEAGRAPGSIGDARTSDLGAVLEGAGLETVEVTPDLARDFGRILRIVVSGVMDILRARQHIKDEFRMRMTQFKPSDNNPLKFSANVEDALHNLLVKRNAAYLEPVEAFEDAFDDVRSHQIAMLTGMRVAFESMLALFDADRLQEGFDRQVKRGALLNVPAKLRYWDLYRDRSHELTKDPEAAFRKLFGEEFAKAYEEQLSRLKADRRAGRGGPPEP